MTVFGLPECRENGMENVSRPSEAPPERSTSKRKLILASLLITVAKYLFQGSLVEH